MLPLLGMKNSIRIKGWKGVAKLQEFFPRFKNQEDDVFKLKKLCFLKGKF